MVVIHNVASGYHISYRDIASRQSVFWFFFSNLFFKYLKKLCCDYNLSVYQVDQKVGSYGVLEKLEHTFWPTQYFVKMRIIIMVAAAPAAAMSLQSCPTLCDPVDGGPPGSPVPGILQARTLEWVAISFRSQLLNFQEF